MDDRLSVASWRVIVVLVDEPRETFEIPVPQKPRKVEFNAENAVLALVKKR